MPSPTIWCNPGCFFIQYGRLKTILCWPWPLPFCKVYFIEDLNNYFAREVENATQRKTIKYRSIQRVCSIQPAPVRFPMATIPAVSAGGSIMPNKPIEGNIIFPTHFKLPARWSERGWFIMYETVSSSNMQSSQLYWSSGWFWARRKAAIKPCNPVFASPRSGCKYRKLEWSNQYCQGVKRSVVIDLCNRQNWTITRFTLDCRQGRCSGFPNQFHIG